MPTQANSCVARCSKTRLTPCYVSPSVLRAPCFSSCSSIYSALPKYSDNTNGAHMSLILILLAVIVFIVLATSKFKVHPFLALLAAAFIAAFAYRLPLDTIADTITSGFGGILGYIGLVIVLGTIIGVILEKSGAAITMADVVIAKLGDRFPNLTMSIIGYIVSIPVFCDSGFVILNSLKESLAKKLETSPIAMSVALATGLYATHTFVPPTPGPIAAAGNLGLESNLGLVIGVGVVVAATAALAGLLWAGLFSHT